MTRVDQSTGEITDALTDAEYDDLETLETTISKGLDTFVEVGNALAEIRDRRLYRQFFPSFDAYCTQQWDIGKSRAYRLIAAAEVVAEMSPAGDTLLPKTERAARELKDVDPAKRADVMAKASEDGPATAPKIREAAAELDPALRLRKEQEAARAKARADKAAEEAQAKADAAVLAAAQAEMEAQDVDVHATKENAKVRAAISTLLDLDPAAGRYCDDTARRFRRLDALEQWCRDHRASLEQPAATLHSINGGA